MPRHILVPLDGSPLAAAAVPYAITLARTDRARVGVPCSIVWRWPTH